MAGGPLPLSDWGPALHKDGSGCALPLALLCDQAAMRSALDLRRGGRQANPVCCSPAERCCALLRTYFPQSARTLRRTLQPQARTLEPSRLHEAASCRSLARRPSPLSRICSPPASRARSSGGAPLLLRSASSSLLLLLAPPPPAAPCCCCLLLAAVPPPCCS